MQLVRFCLVFLVPLGAVISYFNGGYHLLIPPLAVFVLLPLFDYVFGLNVYNPDPGEEKILELDRRYRWITFAAVPVQVGLVFWGAWAFTHGSLNWWDRLVFAYGVGLSSGIMGINLSHELIHKVNNRVEPLLGRIMLWTVLYSHWAVEHVAGHHRYVATPEDPATARFGESFWQFLPRTVIGGMESAWRIESEMVESRGGNKYGWDNRILRYFTAQGILIAFMAYWLGLPGVIFLLIQAATAVLLLELVNYVEHYGLVREQNSDGSYEEVKPHHSWNSAHRVTNYFLFNLQRHSDHHYRPNRRYQILRHWEDAPQLPSGYAGMLVLAYFPPIWRKFMDHRVPQRH
ncbi:alkane 1-monooxygenase [Desulfatibacillum alkenivorans DSM 16219]|jgi:alkane 1-monooxygenase|uniref:Alkane 1-monooxygenase n=1 Tax=Desulfatibacillum alkenivorans DSM 16219 TaxID=1121393 RepID=A0A1M6D161_9BACT|nr:alkane 1-monooxygenase [Desulfatibacillum alkenivorans]SHI66853.1 alkane 1-monooxygenase [Desulfatibacillum alkenivorans DSM 16219]